MANQENGKLKLLKLWEYLRDYSDEDHLVSMDDILTHLRNEGISAERKSIYNDLAILQDYGVDIVRTGGPRGGYYIGAREFELPEVKLLADAVAASKFITEKRSQALLKKLEKLVSRSDAGKIQRQVIVADRAKTENESVLYAIDIIHNCIANDTRLSFQYSDWSPAKRKVLRHSGERYLVSPAFLLWDNENYYLVAYDDKRGEIRHYRVDRMVRVEETEEKRGGAKERRALKTGDYNRINFGMYAGEQETVSVRISPELINVVFDRFGTGVSVRPEGEDYIVRIPVAVSPQFFGWMAGLGDRALIVSPESIKEQYREYLEAIVCKLR